MSKYNWMDGFGFYTEEEYKITDDIMQRWEQDKTDNTNNGWYLRKNTIRKVAIVASA